MTNKINLRFSGRTMYICEAAFEYLISILVGGSFLATLTGELGISDSLTGILSSVISLGCLFQLLSVFLRRNRCKPLVIGLSIANQLLFVSLYVIPLAGGSKTLKIIVFIAALIGAYFLYNLAHPKKINWLMSLVDDRQRGSFTATKEIVSLLAGMAFSFAMGAVVDHFVDLGEIRIAFILSAVVMLFLTFLHTVSMLLAEEKPMPAPPKTSLKATLASLVRNRNVIKVMVVFVLYYIAAYCATPFYGTYQIGELGFSLKLVTVLGMMGSIARIFVSKFWGRYADRYSFAAMMERCLMILAAAYLCAALSVPANGKIMFALYFIFHGIAQGGINSALINLVFDYVEPEHRSDSLAICQAASGTAGFFATLAASPLVTLIQQKGNTLFGIPMYAQQLLSLIGLLFILAAMMYVRMVVMRHKKTV